MLSLLVWAEFPGCCYGDVVNIRECCLSLMRRFCHAVILTHQRALTLWLAQRPANYTSAEGTNFQLYQTHVCVWVCVWGILDVFKHKYADIMMCVCKIIEAVSMTTGMSGRQQPDSFSPSRSVYASSLSLFPLFSCSFTLLHLTSSPSLLCLPAFVLSDALQPVWANVCFIDCVLVSVSIVYKCFNECELVSVCV